MERDPLIQKELLSVSDISSLIKAYENDKGGNQSFQKNQINFWRDFPFSFSSNSQSGDVLSIDDEISIKQHLKNLFALNQYDKLFHPEIYTGVSDLLFENWDSQLKGLLEEKLKLAIIQWETRIDIISLTVEDDDHVVSVTLVFKLKNKQDHITFKTILKRLR